MTKDEALAQPEQEPVKDWIAVLMSCMPFPEQ